MGEGGHGLDLRLPERFHGTRPDVECCAPKLSMSRGMSWRPPRCPIFD